MLGLGMRTECFNHVNYQLKWALQKTFFSLTPPPAWISIRQGVWIYFWNNPF